MLTKEQEEGLAYDAAKLNMDLELYKEWRLSQYGDAGYKAMKDEEVAAKSLYVREIPVDVLQPLYEGIMAQKEALKVAEAMKALEEAPEEK